MPLIDEALQPLKPIARATAKAVEGIAKEIIEQKSIGAKQPWHTIKKISDLVERSKK